MNNLTPENVNDIGLLLGVLLFVLFAAICYETMVKPQRSPGRKVPTAKDIENARAAAATQAFETSAERLSNDAKAALLVHAQTGRLGPVMFEALQVSGGTVADAQRLLMGDGFTCSYCKSAGGYSLTIDISQNYEE